MLTCPIKGDYNPFTDWRPRCTIQYQDMIANKLPSSLDYRMYLTANAEKIMQYNTQKAYDKNKCLPCYDKPTWNDGTMLREFDSQKCDARTCTFRQADPWGLGRQRNYYDSTEINDKFIAMKEQENNWFKENKVPMAYSSLYETVGDETVQRYHMPSGADIKF